MKTHRRSCHLCEAMCGLEITTESGVIQKIKGDPKDPFSSGAYCPKGPALQDIHEDPDRLKGPMRRHGSRWEPIGWEDAFDLVVSKIEGIQSAYGQNALGVYQGNPTVHSLGATMFGHAFVRALGTKNRFSASSVDQLPQMVASLLLFGDQLLIPVPDVDRTQYFLVFGANPVASGGSLLSAPGLSSRMKQIQKRGGKVVVFDPRYTETASQASEHHFIRPGTDALVLVTIIQEVMAMDRDRPGGLAPHLDGIQEVLEAIKRVDTSELEARTGVSRSVCRTIADEFSKAPHAVCYGRLGISTQDYGSLCAWLIHVLNIVTGRLDQEGGSMFTTPAFDGISLAHRVGIRGSYGRRKSRVKGMLEFSGEFPVATLADEILVPGDGQIRGMMVHAGNPVLSTPNGRKLEKAFQSLEFMVAIDFYLNETTRFADVILPPTSPLERSHYDIVFNLLAIRNVAKYSAPLFPKPKDARHDWEIFLELTKRLSSSGKKNTMLARMKYEALLKFGPELPLNYGLIRGPYGFGKGGLHLGKLKKRPEGLDLGPLKSVLPERLMTKNGKIQLHHKIYLNELERLSRERSKSAGDQLLLIGRRQLKSNNSWMHNASRLMGKKVRCNLLIHPEDAQKLGLESGNDAVVASAVGEVTIPVLVSKDMMPGTVSIPHGWGHDRPGTKLRVAARTPGVSINDLTDDARVDPISGNASFSGTPVTIELARE